MICLVERENTNLIKKMNCDIWDDVKNDPFISTHQVNDTMAQTYKTIN